MPKPQPQDWSQAYAKIQRLADRSVLAVLRQALDDINRMMRQIDPNLARVGDLVRMEQLQTVKRNLLNEQSKIFNRMGDIIAERRAQAALQATLLGSAIDDAVFGTFGEGAAAQRLRSALVSGLNQTIDVAITRMTISSVPLSQQIYLSNVWANGVLQRRINSALLRGLSAQEFAKEARAWFNPMVPGGVRYAAMRLARTEINNAFHATSVLQAQEKPWITSVQWHLSRSHPKADDCDKLAKGGPKGDGVYPKMEVPRKPHPQCFCFVTPVSPDEDEFLDGLVAGKYDQYLHDKMSGQRVAPQVQPKKVEPKPKAQPKKATTRPMTGAISRSAAKPKVPATPAKPKITEQQRMQALYGKHLTVHNSGELMDKYMKDLGSIPDRHHNLVVENFRRGPEGAGIYVGLGDLPTLSPQARARLTGQQPRGWPAGSTWEQVPGCYMGGLKQLLIGNERKHGHGCASLVTHEFGHALDDSVAASFASTSGAFTGPAAKLSRSKTFSLTPYVSPGGNPTGWHSELFAEGYSGWSTLEAADEGTRLYHFANNIGYAKWDFSVPISQRAERTLDAETLDAMRSIMALYERIGK